MIKKSKEELSLDEMLTFVGLPVLPEPNDENKTWVKAIVQIERRTGIKDYVVATHDVFGWNGIRVKKESAGNGIARGVLGIYPFEYLLDKFFPKVSSKKDIINYIAMHSNEDKTHLSNMSKDALKNMFMQVCINEQLSNHIPAEQRRFFKEMIGAFSEKKEETINENENKNEEDGSKKETGEKTNVDGSIEEDF